MHNKLIQNLENYEKALVSLETNIIKIQGMKESAEDYDIYRDSTIQRFEYTMESAKKLMMNYIEYVDARVLGQKEILKKAFEFDLVDDDNWLEMSDNFNLVMQEYNENLLDEFLENIYIYTRLFRRFFETIKINIEKI